MGYKTLSRNCRRKAFSPADKRPVSRPVEKGKKQRGPEYSAVEYEHTLREVNNAIAGRFARYVTFMIVCRSPLGGLGTLPMIYTPAAATRAVDEALASSTSRRRLPAHRHRLPFTSAQALPSPDADIRLQP